MYETHGSGQILAKGKIFDHRGSGEPVDRDGDGKVYDGTKDERPAPAKQPRPSVVRSPVIARGEEGIQSLLRRVRGALPNDDLSGLAVRGAIQDRDVGPIDLLWGVPGDRDKKFANGYGLSHAIARRIAVDRMSWPDVEKLITAIPRVIAHGKRSGWAAAQGSSDERMRIDHGDQRVVLSRGFKGQARPFVLTTFRVILRKSLLDWEMEEPRWTDNPIASQFRPTHDRAAGGIRAWERGGDILAPGQRLVKALPAGVHIDHAAARADRWPTPARVTAGNYRKGHIRLHGLDVTIETPAGAERSGVGPDGVRWCCTMPAHYGYFRRTEGADGDQVDVFIGPHPDSRVAWVVDQFDAETGTFDEHKVLVGWHHLADALLAYDRSFSDGRGPERRKRVTQMPISALKAWLRHGNTAMPLAKAAPPDDPLALARAIEERVAAGVARALNWLTGKAANDVIDALTGQEVSGEAAAAALPRGDFTNELDSRLRPLNTAFTMGARETANSNLPPGSEGRDKVIAVSFDLRNPAIDKALNDYRFGLIQQITDGQEATIRSVVQAAMLEGLPPAVMARRIRDTIGLTEAQAQHVLNYRRELEQGKIGALTRALRDRRYDAVVASALDGRTTLSGEQVDRMVEAYRRRYVAYRSMTIARTESLRAANAGQRAVIEAAAAAGDLDNMIIRKTWLSTEDDRVRHTHAQLNGQSVDGMETPFVTSKGNRIRWPQDDQAVAEETINCRCTCKYQLIPRNSNSGEPIDVQ